MKTITLSSLCILLFLVSPNVILSQEIKDEVAGRSGTKRQIDAFNLVSAAYRGRLKEWKIPGYARLDQAYRGGQITASDLITAAIEADLLSSAVLEDKAYIHAVDTNLYGLVTR